MDALMYCRLNKKGVKLLKDKEIPLPEEYREVGLPAHKAVFKGDTDALVAIFLEFTEVGVPLEDSYGSSPLHLAARKDDPKTTKWLLDHTDIDPTLRAKKGETAFHVAAAQGSMKSLEVLVSYDVNLKDFISTCLDDSCFTALHLAIIRHHNDIVRYLISKLGNRAIGSVNESGVNAAHVAASVGNVDSLKLIYNKNKKVLHLVAKDLTSPIFFAAQEGHFSTLQYLHQKGKCDLGSRSHDGMSPIHAASQNGHLEIIQYITSSLGKSATFDQTPDGSTPLHFAASAGHEEIIRWLINNDLTGTIALIQDNNGDTPAHDAADNGNTEILKILLDNGADIHAANKDGFTPYALASQGPHADTAAFVTRYVAASPTRTEEKPSKMKIYDLKDMQKESDKEDKDKDEDNEDDTKGYDSVDLSAYDEVTATARLDKDKPILEVNEPSSEKLLDWNKEEIGLFDESKIKPSTISSPTAHDYTSKRQSRKTSKSIKESITSNVGGANSQDESLALFKPNININPLLETGSGTNLEEDTKNTDSLYARPDPEIVKRKSQKRMESKEDPDNVTAVVNEFFDEEEPGDGVEVHPKKYDDKVNGKPNDDGNDKPGDDDKTTDTQAPINDNTAATGDKTTEEAAKPSTVPTDEAEKKVSQLESATDQGSKEPDQTGREEDQTKNVADEEDNTAISTSANEPLIKVARSKTPSSPGKYGLKQASRKQYGGFTTPLSDELSGAGDELRKVFAARQQKN